MTTYPLATLGPTISSTGITAPGFADIYQSLVASFQGIYGADVVLTPDTQDGQWLGVIARAVADSNAACVAVFNGFSPVNAQGVALSSLVKLNGLRRKPASNSAVDVQITGTPGTVIANASFRDQDNNIWKLPASVILPASAAITVTATCATAGAIPTPTSLAIDTPTYGWLTLALAGEASPGNAVESDAQLRARQAAATTVTAQSPMDAIAANVAALAGVTRVSWDENVSGETDANGVPGHSFALVVEGGDAVTIARTIFAHKTPGTGTYGTIAETILDPYGIPSTIRFSTPGYVPLALVITLHPLPSYNAETTTAMKTALVDYIAGLAIGESVYLTQLIAVAIEGGGLGAFNLQSLTVGVDGAAPVAGDVVIAWNQAASLSVDAVTLSLD